LHIIIQHNKNIDSQRITTLSHRKSSQLDPNRHIQPNKYYSKKSFVNPSIPLPLFLASYYAKSYLALVDIRSCHIVIPRRIENEVLKEKVKRKREREEE